MKDYQKNAQIKLLEIWKAVNLENYPLKINKKVSNESTSVTWSSTQGKLIEIVYFFLFFVGSPPEARSMER